MSKTQRYYSLGIWKNINRTNAMRFLPLTDKNPQQKEDHENSKHLDHQPAVAADSTPVLQKFSLSTADVRYDIFGIGIDPLDHFCLLGDHLSELGKYTSQFVNRRFDGCYGIGSAVQIGLVRRLFF